MVYPERNMYFAVTEVQNMSPQNMLLWYMDYLGLKALEEQQINKGSPTCRFYLKADHNISREKAALPAPGKERSYHWGLGVNDKIHLYKRAH